MTISTASTQSNKRIQIPKIVIKKLGEDTSDNNLETNLENFILRNFGKYFNQILHEYGLKTEESAIVNRSYELLLDFHASNQKKPFSSRYFKAAGARAIQEMCLRRNKCYELRGVCRQLKISLQNLTIFPLIPRSIQISMILESIEDEVSSQVLAKTKFYVNIFIKKVAYPKGVVSIAMYHATLSCKEEFSLQTIAKIINISASTLYILRNKFPIIPESPDAK